MKEKLDLFIKYNPEHKIKMQELVTLLNNNISNTVNLNKVFELVDILAGNKVKIIYKQPISHDTYTDISKEVDENLLANYKNDINKFISESKNIKDKVHQSININLDEENGYSKALTYIFKNGTYKESAELLNDMINKQILDHEIYMYETHYSKMFNNF